MPWVSSTPWKRTTERLWQNGVPDTVKSHGKHQWQGRGWTSTWPTKKLKVEGTRSGKVHGQTRKENNHKELESRLWISDMGMGTFRIWSFDEASFIRVFPAGFLLLHLGGLVFQSPCHQWKIHFSSLHSCCGQGPSRAVERQGCAQTWQGQDRVRSQGMMSWSRRTRAGDPRNIDFWTHGRGSWRNSMSETWRKVPTVCCSKK